MVHHQPEQLHVFGVILDTDVELVFASVVDNYENWLTATEYEQINQLPPHRRRSRLAGQLAAKQLLHRIYALPPHTTCIQHYPSGAPYGQAAEHCYDLSISHSAAWGAAALSLHPAYRVGIDLVKKRAIHYLDDLVAKTLDSSEQKLLAEHQTDFFALWALKEAALKTWLVGMRLPIWDVHVRALNGVYQIEADGFPPLFGKIMELSPQVVSGITWGIAPPGAEWLPRGLHMGA